MAGENILVVDDNVAVQELCRSVLEGEGYRVSVASNGVAALSHPDMADIDLLIIDTHMREMSGYETTRSVKTDPDLYRKPILLLVPEEESSSDESQNLLGANSFLKKPFEPNLLVNKVQVLLEERQILERGREYLRTAADQLMTRLADTTIQQAVEQKTQIIVERVIQTVITQIDQKTRREVDSRVTQLTAEKEQELVKMTVHEVARSMVEKLAERKVTEAMESVLREETERSVRRVADSLMPGIVRDRVKESVDQVLPKEVTRRVQKEAEDIVNEASQRLLGLIESTSQRVIPKIAKDITGEVVERKFAEAVDVQLPKHVQSMVAQELEAQIRIKIAPLVKEAAKNINRRIFRLLLAAIIVVGIGFSFLIIDHLLGASAPWAGGAAEDVEDAAAAPAGAAEQGNALQRMFGLPKPSNAK